MCSSDLTFPHAIAWHMRGGNAMASHKESQRLALLEQAGIDPKPLTHIDWIDAALCAVAAHQVGIGGPCATYGEPQTGLIVVPSPSAPPTPALHPREATPHSPRRHRPPAEVPR